MDPSVLPEIFALIVLISFFQPIVSRVRNNANVWIVGWAFLLLHYIARMSSSSLQPWQLVTSMVVSASLPCAMLCFLNAAANTSDKRSEDRVDRTFTAELAIPCLLQCGLAVLPRHSSLGEGAVALALLVPGLHLLLDRRRRRQPLLGLSVGSGAAGLLLLVCAGVAPSHLTADLLFQLLTLYVAVSYLFYCRRLTRARVVAVFGIVAWGASYSAADLLRWFAPETHLNRSLLELPQFVFAAGVLLALIDQLLAQIEHLAMHDPLTGLPNRRRFEEYIGAAMAHAGATETPLAFLVIDVDDFKQTNDTLGHHVGDELLRSLGVRLSWNIGPADLLARTGGDEFSAVLAGFSDVHHLRFVARTMMSAASVPFIVDGQSIDFRISIGIAVAPYDATDIASLRKAADEAMYQAKRHGGSRLMLASEIAAVIQTS